ncbi:MAG: phosphopantothenoylcysteine decarboxylase [Pseudomonadota bacterium]
MVIGFAAETHDVDDLAIAKLKRKRCDWIVANDVSGDVMGGSMNQVSLVTRQGIEDRWPRMSKQDVADRLAERIAAGLGDATDQIAAE